MILFRRWGVRTYRHGPGIWGYRVIPITANGDCWRMTTELKTDAGNDIEPGGRHVANYLVFARRGNVVPVNRNASNRRLRVPDSHGAGDRRWRAFVGNGGPAIQNPEIVSIPGGSGLRSNTPDVLSV
jgi:hypothetical protein